MQNKTLLYGVVAVIVVAGGIWWWMMSGASATQQAAPQSQSTSLKGLLAMGGSQKCTFTNSTANSESSGTVYVANGQMRGDFTSTSQGKVFQSHMIVKDATSYMWSDAMPQGIKMSFDSMSSNSSQQSGVDPNAQSSYSCSAWSADASLFVTPAGITFQELSAMVPAAGAGNGGSTTGSTTVTGSASQCGACDAAPNAQAKAQCRLALHCQ